MSGHINRPQLSQAFFHCSFRCCHSASFSIAIDLLCMLPLWRVSTPAGNNMNQGQNTLEQQNALLRSKLNALQGKNDLIMNQLGLVRDLVESLMRVQQLAISQPSQRELLMKEVVDGLEGLSSAINALV